VLHCIDTEKSCWANLEIHHHPDHSKSRASYLSLLQLGAVENPEDPRSAYYYARELYFYQMKKSAIEEFKRFLNLPNATWKPERAKAMRYLYSLTNDVKWLWDAVDECPHRREGWVELAQHGYNTQDWPLVVFACYRAFSVTTKTFEYQIEQFAWNEKPHDLMALAAYYLGLFDLAKKHGKIALEMSPEDERLRKNWDYYAAK
jgi:tetratricopeptide (TPR) repeat protein